MSRLSDFSAAVHTELNDATVERVNSRRRDGRHGKRRRIHWYSDGGAIDIASQAGGRETTSGTVREPAVWERLERVTCLVFAENEDSLDTLLDNLIVAISRVAANGSAIFDSYTWQYNEVAQRIPVSELTFDLKLPVVDEYSPLVVITDEEHDCIIE